MIIRIVTASVKEGKTREYDSFIDEIAIPMFRKHAGCEQIIIGRDYSDPSKATSVTISVWKDLRSLREFTGPNHDKVVIFPRERKLTKGRPTVQHYDLVQLLETSS